MNKILKVCLFLLVLAISKADAQDKPEEKGLFTRFIELLSISSNPSYENSKYIPLEKSHASFMPKQDESLAEITSTSNDQKTDSNPQATENGVNHDQNWDKNTYIQTSNNQQAEKIQTDGSSKSKKGEKLMKTLIEKHQSKNKDSKKIVKPAIFKNSEKKNKVFKEENTEFKLVQTEMKEDPQPAAVAAPPQGGTIEDSKTAESVDALKSQIKEDVTKATEEMKDNMKQNNEEMKEQLKSATDDLQNQISQAENNITSVVKNESKIVQDELDKSTKKIEKAVDAVGLKVDDNLVQTIKLRIMALEDQLEKKQEELDEVAAKASELRATLPPPKTICDTFFDCSSCTSNSKCGWCIAEQKCVEGDNVGPLHMSCNFYDFKLCSGGGCSRYKDCDSCIGDPLCGFCDENKKCLERPADFAGCKPTSWFHSQGTQNQCPLPDVTSQDPLKDVPPKKIVEDGSVPKQAVSQAEEPEAEKELIRKKQDQLIKLESQQNQIKIEIDEIKKELNKAKAERDKYEKILADNEAAINGEVVQGEEGEEEELFEEEQEEEEQQQEEEQGQEEEQAEEQPQDAEQPQPVE